MQRRAAAIYAAFFVVVAATSYSLIATAQEPTVQFEGEEAMTEGDTLSAGGTTYTVSEVSATTEGGDHGSPVRLVRSGELQWRNESARYTETWDNGSTVTFRGEERAVVVENASDPSRFELREVIDREGILAADPSADNQTVTRDGEEFVVVTEDGTSRLVPAAEYFPTPATTAFSEGETVDYRGNETTLEAVSSDGVTLAWTAPRTNTQSLSDRGNVTLGGETYLAVFPDNSSVVLTQNFDSYRTQQSEIDRFTRYRNGLWGVSILGSVSAVLLVGLAYLPSRY
jgi:hypothetical protein